MAHFRPFFMAVLLLTGCGQQKTEPSLPTAPVVVISPQVPVTTDDLVASISVPSADPEGKPVTYRYEWTKDGVVQTSLTSGTVPAFETRRGEAWAVKVTPSTEGRDGTSGTASATIANSAPSVALTFEPAVPTRETGLTLLVTSSDADEDVVTTPTLRWIVDGNLITPNGASIPGTQLRRGQTWSVDAIPFDGESSGELVSASVVVGNVLPIIDAITFVPTSPNAATGASASVSAHDPDGDALSGDFSWFLDGQPIAGTNGNNVAGNKLQRGHTLKVTVLPRDGVGVGSPVSAEVGVGNAPPFGPQITITTAPAHDQDITCTLASPPADPDGDAVEAKFTWTRNGVPYASAIHSPTSSTVPAADTTEMDTFTCTVVVTETTTPEKLSSEARQVTATVGCLSPLRTGPTCSACVSGRSGALCEVREWAEWPMPTAPGLNLAHPASFLVTAETVQDQVTGLEWQKQTDGVIRPAVESRLFCENLVLDGKDDWRLPSRIEFLSIYDMTGPTPYLYPDFVPGPSSYVWTATKDASNPDSYYRLSPGTSYQGNFGLTGQGGFVSGLDTNMARCIRGGPASPPSGPHYTVTNGVVRDNYTGLEWERQNTSSNLTSGDAASYCQGLTLSGGGWRLPTINELSTLVNDTARSPSLDVLAFPYALTAGNWSSTSVVGATGYTWLINFTDGSLVSSGTTQLGVRCVR